MFAVSVFLYLHSPSVNCFTVIVFFLSVFTIACLGIFMMSVLKSSDHSRSWLIKMLTYVDSDFLNFDNGIMGLLLNLSLGYFWTWT